MISLNAPLRSGDGQLLDMFGVEQDPSRQVDTDDELERVFRRLRPLERALVETIHKGELTIEEAAARLGVSALAITRRLRAAERKCRGRTRSSGTPAPLAGVEASVGTIRVRTHGHNYRCRFIKVCMQPPRWEAYARWWWQQNRGPIPDGKQVLHKNGNTLDDSPDNLVLGGHADRAFLYQARSESNLRHSMDACRKGCAKSNTERALARDLLGVLRRTAWYAIDHQGRTITGPYGYTRASVYDALRIPRPAGWDNSDRAWISSLLGWPGLEASAALVLQSLVDSSDGLVTSVVVSCVEAISFTLGFPFQPTTSCITQALYRLRKERLAITTRNGSRQSRHKATLIAKESRGSVCWVNAARGSQCELYRNDGYAVVTPRFSITVGDEQP